MFDKEKHIKEMLIAARELIEWLEKRGVYFSIEDGDLENVIFYDLANEEYRISHHCFFRFSGPCVYYKVSTSKKGVDTVEPLPLTKEMFYNVLMKAILAKIFNLS